MTLARLVFGDENSDDDVPSAEFSLDLMHADLAVRGQPMGGARFFHDYVRRNMPCPVNISFEQADPYYYAAYDNPFSDRLLPSLRYGYASAEVTLRAVIL